MLRRKTCEVVLKGTERGRAAFLLFFARSFWHRSRVPKFFFQILKIVRLASLTCLFFFFPLTVNLKKTHITLRSSADISDGHRGVEASGQRRLLWTAMVYKVGTKCDRS